MRQKTLMSAASPARSSAFAPAPQIWVWLIVAGIALYTVFSVMLNHAMRGDLDNPVFPNQSLIIDNKLPLWGQTLGHVAMAMILLGGLLYATAPTAVRLGRHYRVLMFAWVGYSLVLAFRNLQPRDFLTSAVYSPLAPGCAIASCLLFASADRDSWRRLVRIVAYGSVGVSLIALIQLAQMRQASRAEAFWRIDTYAKILEITAIVGYGWFARTRRAWLGVIPVAVLVAATVAMQTRLMVVELVSLLAFYRLFSQRKLSANALIPLCLAGLMILGTVYFAWYSPVAVRSVLPTSATAFWDRTAEDTRSDQFVNFFAKVPPSTFLLGIGIPRQGEFNGLGEKGLDLGYVNILFIGGVLALFLYFVIHLLPAVRSMGDRFDSVDAACMASVMTYGVRLLSSTIPGFYPAYFILLLLMGRCVVLAQEHRLRYRSVHSGYLAERFASNRQVVAIGSND
jgi:hypothetical protein